MPRTEYPDPEAEKAYQDIQRQSSKPSQPVPEKEQPKPELIGIWDPKKPGNRITNGD